jgi:outer membrane receptor protein involved in Fe transport
VARKSFFRWVLNTGSTGACDIPEEIQNARPILPSAGILLYPQDKVIYVSNKNNNVSPEATLSWHPQPSETLYAAYKAGYKAGSIANPPTLAATATA